jgi:superoxide dismutase
MIRPFPKKDGHFIDIGIQQTSLVPIILKNQYQRAYLQKYKEDKGKHLPK